MRTRKTVLLALLIVTLGSVIAHSLYQSLLLSKGVIEKEASLAEYLLTVILDEVDNPLWTSKDWRCATYGVFSWEVIRVDSMRNYPRGKWNMLPKIELKCRSPYEWSLNPNWTRVLIDLNITPGVDPPEDYGLLRWFLTSNSTYYDNVNASRYKNSWVHAGLMLLWKRNHTLSDERVAFRIYLNDLWTTESRMWHLNRLRPATHTTYQQTIEEL